MRMGYCGLKTSSSLAALCDDVIAFHPFSEVELRHPE
jgi:hypothetical protein